MEFIDRFFGLKRRRQEKLLQNIEINNRPRLEFVGADDKEALVAEVSNDHFLKLIKEREIKSYEKHTRPMSDTHDWVDLYIDLGEDTKIKTGCADIFYRKDRNLLNELYDMSFRPDPEKSKSDWSGVWSVHKRADQ